ncbi:hypothetical protein GJ496_002237 [Pomphorhynchus laevis]|nr:hypothetical protein GJ496_002237 [Pomphorhynchus laevis]
MEQGAYFIEGLGNEQSKQVTVTVNKLNESKSYDIIPPLQRSISTKKSVQFADALGLQLVTIFSRSNSTSSLSEMIKKQCSLEKPMITVNENQELFKWYVIKGPRLKSNSSAERTVSLESISGIGTGELKGTVKIHKPYSPNENVKVRYTLDSWRCYFDEKCRNALGEDNDNLLHFSIFPPHYYDNVDICMAICYTDESNTEYWDNNEGQNYSIVRTKV